MNDRSLVIWGCGGHSRVVADTARELGWHISARVFAPAQQSKLSADLIAAEHVDEVFAIMRQRSIRSVALGFGECAGRLMIAERVQDSGFTLETLVHPTAWVSPNAALGKGAFVGAGAVVEAGAMIGDYTIVNTRAIVCHDSTIGRACHICPGAIVAGAVSVGDLSWIGAGAVLRDRVTIPATTFIGCGSVVVKSIVAAGMAYGNPASVRKPCPAIF